MTNSRIKHGYSAQKQRGCFRSPCLTPMFSMSAWLRGLDLNQRPLGYEPNELPDCSTPQRHDSKRGWKMQPRFSWPEAQPCPRLSPIAYRITIFPGDRLHEILVVGLRGWPDANTKSSALSREEILLRKTEGRPESLPV